MLKAGVAIFDITPKEPLFLAGYPEPEDRFGNSVHDPLYCTAYYLGNKEEIMMLCLDLVGVTKMQTLRIREGINKATGIKKENISVSCTHTHSGPTTTSPNFELFNEDKLMYPEYMDYCIKKIIDTGIKAYNESFKAKVGYGSTICGKAQNIGGNRRHKDGVSDEQVYAIGIKDMDGKMRGVIASYSLHPTLLHSDSYAYSADYPGYMREYFSNEYPGSIFGFQMGTSGNQSSRHFRSGQNFEEAKRYGYTLGAAAKKALENAEYKDDVILKAASVWVDPILKDFLSVEEADANAKKAQDDYDQAKAAGIPYADLRTLECTLIGANYMAAMSKQLLEPGALEGMMKTYPFELQAIRIDDLSILFVAGECFVEIGLEIKERSPFKNTYVATTSNGSALGYICTPEAHKEGGYEAVGSILRPETTQKVIEEGLKAIELVK
jgi:neutral ceramidase